MTQNQIAYHNAIELERHNKASEFETARHQRVQEQLQHRSNELSHESNIISKEHFERMDAINSRHYENQDAYNAAYLEETQRSHLASEQLTAQQQAINAAANAELARHQRVTEGIESSLAENTRFKTQYDVSYISANADYTRQRAAESAAATGLIGQQTITEISRGQNVWADTRLKNAQTKTEKTRPYLNVSEAFDTNVSTASKLGRLLGLGISVK